MASMKATATLKDDENMLAQAAYDAIESFFSIFSTPREKIDQGAELLKKICDDAVALCLMMRTAKDEYRVDMLSRAVGKPVSKFDKVADDDFYYPVVLEDEVPNTIAYFVSGALIKIPYENTQDRKILEKAQAAIYNVPHKKV